MTDMPSMLKPPEPPSSLTVQHGGSHYKSLPIQPVEYCHKNGLLFCESSAIKYITRHGTKGGAEDLRKAIHFIQMALEMDYGVKSNITYTEGKNTDESE